MVRERRKERVNDFSCENDKREKVSTGAMEILHAPVLGYSVISILLGKRLNMIPSH